MKTGTNCTYTHNETEISLFWQNCRHCCIQSYKNCQSDNFWCNQLRVFRQNYGNAVSAKKARFTYYLLLWRNAISFSYSTKYWLQRGDIHNMASTKKEVPRSRKVKRWACWGLFYSQRLAKPASEPGHIEMKMSLFWWNFPHWLHWKLSFC